MAARAKDRAAEFPGRSKAVLVLLLLLIVAFPAAIFVSLVGSRAHLPATSGDQPGGALSGRVIGPDGEALGGIDARLFLVSEAGAVTLSEETSTGADGSFSFAAPPHRGKYEIRAGGGEWVLERRELSFLDQTGERVEPPPLELDLEPGCMLAVDLVRASERYEDSGRYELRGRLERGMALGFVRPNLRLTGEFEDGRIEIGGLPALEGSLRIFLDNGDEVELPLDLVPGIQRREIRL